MKEGIRKMKRRKQYTEEYYSIGGHSTKKFYFCKETETYWTIVDEKLDSGSIIKKFITKGEYLHKRFTETNNHLLHFHYD